MKTTKKDLDGATKKFLAMQDVQLAEEMDMPCLCDCGKWFDLDDGWQSKYKQQVVCSDCHNKEAKIDELKDEYYQAEMEGKGTKRLRSKIEKLENELFA